MKVCQAIYVMEEKRICSQKFGIPKSKHMFN